MENLRLQNQFKELTFRNEKHECIIDIRSESTCDVYRIKKSDAIDIIKHLQEWVGIEQTNENETKHCVLHSASNRYLLSYSINEDDQIKDIVHNDLSRIELEALIDTCLDYNTSELNIKLLNGC